jgi:PAS domain S-box-containing protein
LKDHYDDHGKRIRAEDELRKLALAVSQSPESIVITNTDAEIEYANERFLRSTGYNREEVLGQNPRFKQSGKTPRETYVAMWDALKQGRAWRGELYNKRKDGSEFIEFARIFPLCDSDGSITHYVAIQEDISEKKQLAQELDNHRYRLEELVEERTEQLAEARKQAESASRAKSTFVANMSHEIRTPMNAIVGLTHLLQRDDPSPEQAARLRKIDTAADHLMSIINDILDISKIEAGKLTLEQSDFHPEMVFDHILSLFREQAKSKGLFIGIDRNDVSTWLSGDSDTAELCW